MFRILYRYYNKIKLVFQFTEGPSSSALLEAQIEIIDTTSCGKIYSNFAGTTIDQRVVCAGKFGKDACRVREEIKLERRTLRNMNDTILIPQTM